MNRTHVRRAPAAASLLALSLAASLTATPSLAQRAGPELPERSFTLQAGVLGTEIAEGSSFGMVAARADWKLARYVRGEVGLSLARGEVEVGNHTGSTPTFSQEPTRLSTATVGVQAELPLPYVRPYVGAAAGVYLRLDTAGGHRFLSTTQEFPAGVRIPLTERLGARGEVRLRYDEQQGNGQELGAETTLGVTWRF